MFSPKKKTRAKLNRERRERYKKDPEYRKKCRFMSRRYYNANQKVMNPKDRTVIKTKKSEFYSIKHVANAIGVSIDTVRQYHKKGIIPDTTHMDTRGWRLYSPEQIELLRRVFSKYTDKAQIAELLKKGW